MMYVLKLNAQETKKKKKAKSLNLENWVDHNRDNH